MGRKKLTIENNTLFKAVQDIDKSLEAFVIPKSLALTILVNSSNLQGKAGTCNTYSLIKIDFFWKGM